MSSINYEIESKSDFLTGMHLVVRVPDSEVDENALYTIQGDCPGFIVPFKCKSINGQTELTYKVGTLCRLQYFYGEVSHAEYAKLWRGLLSPLIECRDWFMNPSSFVLSADYLYYDKNKETVAYIYIPSKTKCSGHEAFIEMAVEVAKNIKVSDPALENRVMRSIINDFNPDEFLKMLSEHAMFGECEQQDEAESYALAEIGETADTAVQGTQPGYEKSPQPHLPADKPPPTEIPELQTKKSTAKKKARASGVFGIFGSREKKNAEAKEDGFQDMMPVTTPLQTVVNDVAIPDFTQEVRSMMNGAGFRCIGRLGLPQGIEVKIEDGEIFTIGRHDANIGVKRSSFEFEAKTKAISRRHAAIERSGAAYSIIDLSSSAGTFVDNKKLPPNTLFPLENGCRVSFGNLGADYVWEAG